MSNTKINEIVEKQISSTGKVNYIYYVIVETKYGLCKLRKKQFNKNKRLTRQCAINPTEFLQNESNEIHNFEFEILDTYTKNDVLINIKHKICNTTFQQSPSTHLRVKGCPICYGRYTKSFEQIVEKANLIHSNKYTYIKTENTNSNSSLNIICPVHGLFTQKVKTHLEKHGCPKCAKQNTGWNRSSFISKCNKNNNGLGILYVLRCWNENEEFYKIGITSKSIKDRYKSKTLMPYNYEIIQEITNLGSIIYDLEKYLKVQINKMGFNIKPKIPFLGSSTECCNF